MELALADQRNLSRNLQVITFDPRGISRSKLNDGSDVSISLIADDIAVLLDLLGIDKAHVVGISFGGFVAQEFALRHPKRLNKLIIASSSFGGPNHVAPSMAVLSAFASTEGLNSPERIRRYITTAFTSEFARDHSDTVDRFCKLREQNIVPENVYRQQLASAMTFNAEDRICNIVTDTLVITGSDDTVVPTQNSRNLVERLPNGRLAVIDGSGHMAFVERASEFNEIVMDFLVR